MAAEVFRRWNEGEMVEARRMVSSFKSAEELRHAFAGFVATGAPEAYVLLPLSSTYFEQLAAMERLGALFDLTLIQDLLGMYMGPTRGSCGSLALSYPGA